jgi:hypothetical protein
LATEAADALATTGGWAGAGWTAAGGVLPAGAGVLGAGVAAIVEGKAELACLGAEPADSAGRDTPLEDGEPALGVAATAAIVVSGLVGMAEAGAAEVVAGVCDVAAGIPGVVTAPAVCCDGGASTGVDTAGPDIAFAVVAAGAGTACAVGAVCGAGIGCEPALLDAVATAGIVTGDVFGF